MNLKIKIFFIFLFNQMVAFSLKKKHSSIKIFILCFLAPQMAFSQNNQISEYTCKINSDCLNHVTNNLLSKHSVKGIQKQCQTYYDKSRPCCKNLLQCKVEGISSFIQTFKNNSFQAIKRNIKHNCDSDTPSSNLLNYISSNQTMACDFGVQKCRNLCAKNLYSLKNTFKQCFGIPQSLSLDEILKKAESLSTRSPCWRSLWKTAQLYKEISLNKGKSLRENMSPEDIIKCENIKKEQNSSNTKNIAENMCQEVKLAKKKEEEEREAEKKRKEEAERQAKQREQEEAERQAEQRKQEEAARQAEQRKQEEAERQAEQRKQEEAERQAEQREQGEERQAENQPTGNQSLQKEADSLIEKSDSYKDIDTKLEKARKEEETAQIDFQEITQSLQNLRSTQTNLEKELQDLKSRDILKITNRLKELKSEYKTASEKHQDLEEKYNQAIKENKSSEEINQLKNEMEIALSSANKIKATHNEIVRTSKNRAGEAKQILRSLREKTEELKQTQDNIQKAETNLKEVEEKIQQAQSEISELKKNKGDKCSIVSPKIKSAVLFQSVEAPQIEPMKDQADTPYNDYDLVMKKPAGILIDLSDEEMDATKEFSLGFYISGSHKYHNYCFHNPMDEKMKKSKKPLCSFTKADFQNSGGLKFLPLPMEKSFLHKEGAIQIKIILFPTKENKVSCLSQKHINAKLIKTQNLKLGFTRILDKTGKCSYGDSISLAKVKDYSNSEELKYITAMFPLNQIETEILKYDKEEEKYDYIQGACEREEPLPPGMWSNELHQKDIQNIMEIRAETPYDKMVVIVTQKYFHEILNSPNQAGAVEIKTVTEHRVQNNIRSQKTITIPSPIILIREDQKNKSSLAHELGHATGKDKEFYSGEISCQHFKKDDLESCKTFRNPISLKADHQSWEFIKNIIPIMNGYKITETAFGNFHQNAPIEETWISRETFQTALLHLSSPPSEIEKRYNASQTKNAKIRVSGFYHESSNQKPQFFSPKISTQKLKAQTESSPENTSHPVVTFQLREGNKTLIQTIRRPIEKFEMKTFYTNRIPEKKPFPSFVMAVFPAPENYKKRDLSIWVFGPGPQPKLLYKAPVFPKKQKKKANTEEVV